MPADPKTADRACDAAWLKYLRDEDRIFNTPRGSTYDEIRAAFDYAWREAMDAKGRNQ